MELEPASDHLVAVFGAVYVGYRRRVSAFFPAPGRGEEAAGDTGARSAASPEIRA